MSWPAPAVTLHQNVEYPSSNIFYEILFSHVSGKPNENSTCDFKINVISNAYFVEISATTNFIVFS